MEIFSQATQEALQYYVYVLVNPLDDKIFYVGKGKDNRVFEHAKAALSTSVESDKLNMIRDIHSKGQQVRSYILRHGLSENEAYLVESIFIDFLTFSNFKAGSSITNIAAGHHQWDKGIKTTQELEAIYNCIDLDLQHKQHKLLCININKTYRQAESIYEITRKSWALNPVHANEADYVVAEYKGIIRAIFKVNEHGWQFVAHHKSYIHKNSKKRFYFEGEEVQDEAICALYLNKRLPAKLKGQANPIMYLYEVSPVLEEV